MVPLQLQQHKKASDPSRWMIHILSFSFLNIASTSNRVMKIVGSSSMLAGLIPAGETLSTFTCVVSSTSSLVTKSMAGVGDLAKFN